MTERILPEEMQIIKKAMKQIVFEYFLPIEAISKIQSYWNENLEEPEHMLSDLEILLESDGEKPKKITKDTEAIPVAQYIDEKVYGKPELFPSPQIAENRANFDWLIGLSSEFLKSLKKVDKKLKGRILDAIQTLSTNPINVKGDTIKPLKNERHGLWRYRVGDFRLVYKPDNINKRVILLTFSSRGSAFSK